MKKNANEIATVATAPIGIGKESFVWDSLYTPTKRIATECHDIVAVKDKIYDLVRKGEMLIIIDVSEGYALEASYDGSPRRQLSGWGYSIKLSFEGVTAAIKAAKAADDKAFVRLIKEYILIKYRRFIKAE